MPKRKQRVNVYLGERAGRFIDGYPSRSARLATIVDRYSEAMRRMRVHERFSETEIKHLLAIMADWSAEPAAALFGGLLLEMRMQKLGTPVLEKKLQALSPFDEVGLVEWLETRMRGTSSGG
jgi:hypothetical protein